MAMLKIMNITYIPYLQHSWIVVEKLKHVEVKKLFVGEKQTHQENVRRERWHEVMHNIWSLYNAGWIWMFIFVRMNFDFFLLSLSEEWFKKVCGWWWRWHLGDLSVSTWERLSTTFFRSKNNKNSWLVESLDSRVWILFVVYSVGSEVQLCFAVGQIIIYDCSLFAKPFCPIRSPKSP